MAAAKVNYFALAWIAGACVVLAAGAIGYLRNMRRIRITATAPDRVLQATLSEVAREAGLSHAPRTLISPAVSSPAVTGLLRPILLLPAGFPAGFNETEARLILLHEFSHLKRLDLPLNWLMCLLQAMHWFNPLLWFAFARMRADRETACDARVLSIDATDRRAEYGGALLKLQCVTPSRALSLGCVGIFERGSEIKSRIREISTHRPGRVVGRVSGATIVSLLMVFGLTKGQSPDEATERENTPGGIQDTRPVSTAKLENPEPVVESPPQSAAPADPAADARKAAIQAKLDSIIIPRIHFEETAINDAIDFLRSRARDLDSNELDPARKGLNFVIRLPRPAAGEAAPQIKELRLRNVPLGTALRYICEATDLHYEVSDHAVIISPGNQGGEDAADPAADARTTQRDIERSFIRRKLRFVKAAEFLPVAANALKRARPDHDEGAQPGGAVGEIADKAPKDAATDTAPESMLVGRTLLVADKVTNSIIVQGAPHELLIVESLLDMLDVDPAHGAAGERIRNPRPPLVRVIPAGGPESIISAK